MERLRQVIDYTGLTQKDFAASVGLTAASISDIFHGRVKTISPTLAIAIQAVHGINADWLLYGTGEMVRSEYKTPKNTNSGEFAGSNISGSNVITFNKNTYYLDGEESELIDLVRKNKKNKSKIMGIIRAALGISIVLVVVFVVNNC